VSQNVINVVVNFVPLGNMSSDKGSPYRSRQFTVFHTRCAFSQHSGCRLMIDGLQFQSALHYMLYEKACEYVILHCYINLCEDYVM